MFTQSVQAQTVGRQRLQFHSVLIATLLSGAILGRLFAYIWPQLPTLAAVGLWPMGTAVAMILVSLTSFHLRPEPLWSFAIGGQLLGVIAIALIFLGYVV